METPVRKLRVDAGRSKGGEVTLVPPLPPSMFDPVSCPRHGPGTVLDGLSDDAFTVRLAFTLGLCKVLCGTATVVLGLAALVLRATLAGLGAGMWAGMVALLAGIVGMLSSRLPRSYAVLVAFLCWSITSLAASALLAVFATTGLVQDLASAPPPPSSHDDHAANATSDDVDDWDQGDEGTVSFRAEPLYLSAFPAHRAATVSNATLVILAVVDCLLSVACVTLVGTETCSCGDGDLLRDAGAWGLVAAERKTRRDRLLNWLDQQQIRSLAQHRPIVPHLEPGRPRTSWPFGSESTPTPCQSCVSRDTLDSSITTGSTLGRRIGPTGSTLAERISPRLGYVEDLEVRY